MSENNIKRATLKELREKRNRGETRTNPNAPEGGEDLGRDFWAKATWTPPRSIPTSVHLKLDPEVFDYFKSQGKGHLTKMQDVLKAYVNAHRQP